MDGRFTVDLPEQVGLEFQLAGIGARFTAAIIDAAVQLSLIGLGLVLAILGIALGLARQRWGGLADEWIALPALAHGALLLWGFTIFWGYHVIFDLSWEGQSPGKRALGLRTLRVDGLPVGPTESALRNLLRPIDLLPIFYGVGGITAILTPLRQRMGDLAAGTVVVRDALSPDALRAAPAPTELSAIAEAWVARRDQLSPDHRAALARAIAQRSGSEDRDAERAVMALARGVPPMSGADRRFRAPREERWRALDELIQRPLSSLSAAEVDALARLHRLAAGDLAAAPPAGAAPQTQAELHARVARGRRALYRPPAIPVGQAISRFYARTLPRLVRANLLAVLASAALVLIPMALTWQAGRGDPGRAYAMASPAQREGARAFTLGWEAGTQGEDKAAASAFYISNNTSVALRAFAGGITLGVLTVWSLIYNGIQLGTTLALVEALGAQRNLGAFVVVHGPAELMAIALAAAGGLVLAGALLRPGARTRAASLAQRAPDALGLAVGAATLLALAGLLEGAVSPSALAPATKVGIGAGVTAAVLLWLGLMGRRSQGGDPEAIAAGQPADAASPEIPIRSPTGRSMKSDLIAAFQAVVEEERQAHMEAHGRPPKRRTLGRRVALRLAEIGVNTFFPTNGSGNNMSRG